MKIHHLNKCLAEEDKIFSFVEYCKLINDNVYKYEPKLHFNKFLNDFCIKYQPKSYDDWVPQSMLCEYGIHEQDMLDFIKFKRHMGEGSQYKQLENGQYEIQIWIFKIMLKQFDPTYKNYFNFLDHVAYFYADYIKMTKTNVKDDE